jgi:enoyl-CoA hydratase
VPGPFADHRRAGHALDRPCALAARLLVNGPKALAATKEIMFQAQNWTDQTAWRAQRLITEMALSPNDRTQGVRAFLEKRRRPRWTGT